MDSRYGEGERKPASGGKNLPLAEYTTVVNEKVAQSLTHKTTFDAIVLGVGSMGSSACYHLAKRGIQVLGIDQYMLPHEQGSHTGQSRLIRKAYFEHPNYVPLLEKAYENWQTLEEEAGIDLYHKTGLLYFGKSDSALIKGVKKSSHLYGIEVSALAPKAVGSEFPQFNIPESYHCLLEPDAGFLTPERAILANVEQALRHGAEIHLQEPVLKWEKEGDSIRVQTAMETYSCKKLLISAGAWSPQFIPEAKQKINITRQVMAWVKPKNWDDFALGKFPCWTLEEPSTDGIFYGFPILDSHEFGPPGGLKIAHHTPGIVCHPDEVDRTVSPEEEEILIQFLNRFLPQGYASMEVLKTCLYTNSPDSDFILDLLPQNENVVIATGFSGHGFKFASVIGQVMAELALEGKSSLPIDFLTLSRFA